MGLARIMPCVVASLPSGFMTMTGDQQLLKRINRMALVRCVRSLPAPSRSDLALSLIHISEPTRPY